MLLLWIFHYIEYLFIIYIIYALYILRYISKKENNNIIFSYLLNVVYIRIYMSLRLSKIVPYPISASINRTSITQNNGVNLYYSKFLAIYYIDLMYNYMDVVTTSCIAIFNRIDIFDRTIHNISNAPLSLKSRINDDLYFLHNKINNNRYVYVEKHIHIIDVNAEKEVLAINFLERKRELSDFINGNYYRELYNVINKRNTVQTQFKDISYIIDNTNFNDDIKKQKIQEYIDKKKQKKLLQILIQNLIIYL